MKICIAGGTRPEWVKLAPIIWELKRRKADFFILDTGQHYSDNMSGVFFRQLGLPLPKYDIQAGSSTHAQQTCRIMMGAEAIFIKNRPDVVVVEGDTNSVFAVAVTAQKMGIKVAHVEAGLRSRDMNMPEEANRIMVDHISDYLLAPTENARNNLLAEGISGRKIFVTGNTVVDTIKYIKKLQDRKKVGIVDGFDLRKKYILLTAHRQENVDNKERLSNIIQSLNLVSVTYPEYSLVFVVHPRTLGKLKQFGFELPKNIRTLPPVDYFRFFSFQKNADMILTDSGGIQEEACVLGVPCVTLRDCTERPESIAVGANRLAGVEPFNVLAQMQIMFKKKKWKNPFGDGRAGKRIVKILLEAKR